MKAVPAVQIDNERVIVTEWTFAPGAETGQHVHGLDYIVVPLSSGTLRLIGPEGSREAQLTAGVSYSRPAGVSHNVINVNAHEFRFLEIELKWAHWNDERMSVNVRAPPSPARACCPAAPTAAWQLPRT